MSVLWCFISKYDITLEDRNFKLPLLQWEFFMECLVLSNRFDKAALIQINWCNRFSLWQML